MDFLATTNWQSERDVDHKSWSVRMGNKGTIEISDSIKIKLPWFVATIVACVALMGALARHEYLINSLSARMDITGSQIALIESKLQEIRENGIRNEQRLIRIEDLVRQTKN
jgi:hypothetical protein